MEDGVAGLDVGEEGVAEALSLRGALHQASDVRHVEERGHFAEMQGSEITQSISCFAGRLLNAHALSRAKLWSFEAPRGTCAACFLNAETA